MMSQPSKVLIGGLNFLLGGAIGIIGALWWAQDGCRAINQVVALHFLATEGESAFAAYRSAKPEVAIYALERDIDLLKSYREQSFRVLPDGVISYDLAIAYGRKGKVAERIGDQNAATKAYEQSLAAFRGAGREIGSIEALKVLIEQLDQVGSKTNVPSGEEKVGSDSINGGFHGKHP